MKCNIIKEWLHVDNFTSYQVSNAGDVKSFHGKWKKWVILKGSIVSGYPAIVLRDKSGFKCEYVHRLVARHFIGPIPDGKEVNHKDSNRKNNSIHNLEYVSRKENVLHAIKKGRYKDAWLQKRKITFRQANEIRRRIKNGEMQKYLAKEYNISRTLVCMINKGKRYA